jgi:histone H3/H4
MNKIQTEKSEATKMGLIVRLRIKEIAGEINVAGDLGDALDKKAEELLRTAIERAKANNRRTVMSKDL